ncbi:unnamed protein product [Plutella xylostella]|uniref:(diamondback moth) hypothetical protein n=1 Tax=Plutella xylostella TaxID=51655 RepID=A0A8S4GC62_PLUXY|nr:unnamed protein product [Plutella xylostella]
MYQKNVGAYYHLGLSQAMVSYSIHEVTEALNQRALLEKYIKFPKTPIEREIISKRFVELFGLPGVIGAIDGGTQVAIIRPVEDEEAYLNRKLYHSINVMAVSSIHFQI